MQRKADLWMLVTVLTAAVMVLPVGLLGSPEVHIANVPSSVHGASPATPVSPLVHVNPLAGNTIWPFPQSGASFTACSLALGGGKVWKNVIPINQSCEIRSKQIYLSQNISFGAGSYSIVNSVIHVNQFGFSDGHGGTMYRAITVNLGNLYIINSTIETVNGTTGANFMPIVLNHYDFLNATSKTTNYQYLRCSSLTPTLYVYDSSLLNNTFVDWGTGAYNQTPKFAHSGAFCSTNSYAYVTGSTVNGTLAFGGTTSYVNNTKVTYYGPTNVNRGLGSAAAAGFPASFAGSGKVALEVANFTGSNPSAALHPTYYGTAFNNSANLTVYGSLGEYAYVQDMPANTPIPGPWCPENDNWNVTTSTGRWQECIATASPATFRSLSPPQNTTKLVKDTLILNGEAYAPLTAEIENTTGISGTLPTTQALGGNLTISVTGTNLTLGAYSFSAAFAWISSLDVSDLVAVTVPYTIDMENNTFYSYSYSGWRPTIMHPPTPDGTTGPAGNNSRSAVWAMVFLAGDANTTFNDNTAALNMSYTSGTTYWSDFLQLGSDGQSTTLRGNTFTDTSLKTVDAPSFVDFINDVANGWGKAGSPLGPEFGVASTGFDNLTIAGNAVTALGINNTVGHVGLLDLFSPAVTVETANILDVDANTIKASGYVESGSVNYGAVATDSVNDFTTAVSNTITLTDTTYSATGTAVDNSGGPLGAFIPDNSGNTPKMFPMLNLTANTVSVTGNLANKYDPGAGSAWDMPYIVRVNGAGTAGTVVDAYSNTLSMTGTISSALQSAWTFSNWTGQSCATVAPYYKASTTPCVGIGGMFESDDQYDVMWNFQGNTVNVTGMGQVFSSLWRSHYTVGVGEGSASGTYPQAGPDSVLNGMEHNPLLPNIRGNTFNLYSGAVIFAVNGAITVGSGVTFYTTAGGYETLGSAKVPLFVGANTYVMTDRSTLFSYGAPSLVITASTPQMLIRGAASALTAADNAQAWFLGSAVPRAIIPTTGNSLDKSAEQIHEGGSELLLGWMTSTWFSGGLSGTWNVVGQTGVSVASGQNEMFTAGTIYSESNPTGLLPSPTFTWNISYNGTVAFTLPWNAGAYVAAQQYGRSHVALQTGAQQAEQFDVEALGVSSGATFTVDGGTLVTGATTAAASLDPYAPADELVANDTIPEIGQGITVATGMTGTSGSYAFGSNGSAQWARVQTAVAIPTGGVSSLAIPFPATSGVWTFGIPTAPVYIIAPHYTTAGVIGSTNVPLAYPMVLKPAVTTGYTANITTIASFMPAAYVGRTTTYNSTAGYTFYATLTNNTCKGCTTVAGTVVYIGTFASRTMTKGANAEPMTIEFSSLVSGGASYPYLIYVNGVKVANGTGAWLANSLGVISWNDSLSGNNTYTVVQNFVLGGGGLIYNPLTDPLFLLVLAAVIVIGGVSVVLLLEGRRRARRRAASST